MAVEQDGTLVLTTEDTLKDTCTLTQFEDKYGETRFDHTGKAICGRERFNTAGSPPKRTRLCANDAGWGTDHRGHGPCVSHGGVPNGTIDPDRNLTTVVENEQLRAILAAEYEAHNIDSLDDEIILLKAMIKMLAATFAIKVIWDGDGLAEVEPGEELEGWRGLTEQSREIGRTITQLANVQKSKYQILQMARETIPRSDVQAYIGQIITIIQNSLRNSCEHCGHEHNMLNNVITSMDIIGGI